MPCKTRRAAPIAAAWGGLGGPQLPKVLPSFALCLFFPHLEDVGIQSQCLTVTLRVLQQHVDASVTG